MKRIKVLLDFIKLVVGLKIVFYRNVLTRLTGNSSFPNPDVSLEMARIAVDTLEQSSIATKDGSRTAISKLHDDEAAADEIFRILAAYVDRMAAGDETKILSSGFHASNQPLPIQKAILAVEDGNHSGSIKLVAKAVEKAGSYVWQMAKGSLPADEAGWTTIGYTTQANNEVNGLDIATKYYFRVAAVTPDGTTDFSAPVLKVVV
jgi:hypothetical protein